MRKKIQNISVPLLSVFLGLVIGAIIMLAFGYNPVQGYSTLFKNAYGSKMQLGFTIRAATPLIFTGLGFSVAYTAGFFNIGLSGQALWGWLISVVIALSMPEAPSFIVLPLAIIGGAVAGALWAAIAGVLKAYFDTSEVIVTIMLNHIAVYISDYLVRYVLTDRADTTPRIGANATLRMNWLTQLTDGSNIHAGIFLAIIFAIIVYYLMNYTTIGFELKAVGLNRHAANYAGMNSRRNIITAMVISGALAGLGGVMSGLGEFRNIFLMNGQAPQIGFDGMAVALLGNLNPIGTIFASFLFGGLQIGGAAMPLGAQIPREIVNIIMGVIIFFVGAHFIITYFLEKIKSEKNTTLVKNVEQGGDQA